MKDLLAVSDNQTVIGLADWTLDCELRLNQEAHCERSKDQRLLQRLREGDRDAFGEIYEQHSRAIFHFAFSMTGDRVVATEITQDVFVWLIHNLNAFDSGRGTFGAFLTGVTRKFLKRRHRDERRWISFDQVSRIQSTEFLNSDRTSDIIRELDEEAVRRAVLLLPWRHREVIVLCEFESKSYEEAAALVRCAVGTIRSRLYRARELLVRKFQPKSPQR